MADGGVTESSAVNVLDRRSVFPVGSLKFWALGDRIIVLQDEFRSGYECARCEGKRKVACGECGGQGSNAVTFGNLNGIPRKKCSHCESGKVSCPDCQGKGGLLEIPEDKQQRPGTGKVVSLGPKCVETSLGDWVMYSQFAGHVVDLNRDGKKYVLRILHETECLCGLDGSLDLRTLRGKSEIAEFHK